MQETVLISGFRLLFLFLILAFAIGFFMAFARRFGWLASFTCVGGFMLAMVMLSYQALQKNQVVVDHHSQSEARSIGFLKNRGGGFGVEENRAPDVDLTRVESDSGLPNAWEEGLVLDANVYPSVADCGRPLAAKLVKYLKDTADLQDVPPKAEAESPTKYRISLRNFSQSGGLNKRDFLKFLIAFREELTASYPGSLVDDMTSTEPPKPKDDKKEKQYQRLMIAVHYYRDGRGEVDAKWNAQSGVQIQEEGGQIACLLKRDDSVHDFEFSTDFIDKPWVADPAKFVSQYPRRRFVIGFSSRLATSEQEARVSALRDINLKLAKSSGKVFKSISLTDQNVIDRFVQKLTKPYGSVWREAVLIDLAQCEDSAFLQFEDSTMAERVARSPNSQDTFMYEEVTQQHLAQTRRSKDVTADVGGTGPKLHRRPNPESMIAGLMMLTIVIGGFSNWLTQGYYRKPVWTVTGTLFSVGFVLLVLAVLISVG